MKHGKRDKYPKLDVEAITKGFKKEIKKHHDELLVQLEKELRTILKEHGLWKTNI